MSPVISSLPSFGDLTGGLGGEVFGSAGNALNTQLQSLLLQGVTKFGVSLASVTAQVVDPTWILYALES